MSLTLACATSAERRAAVRAGARAALIGLAGRNGLPEGRLVSFGLAGALSDELACGEVLDAVRVVDAAGNVLWEGEPLGVGRPATILGADGVVDDPAERSRLRERTGADAVDLESGPLARAGRLAGGVRVVSDTPSRPLDGLARAVRPDGSVDPVGLVRALATTPRGFLRAAGDGRRALRALERVAGELRS